ncbi:protein serine/threonine phosphatase [Ammonifex degensii KC4]|uniref:Protein serine/threonine phosphatase n=1 Tax=Ammonifex degensii (strain DSM 10501 / KC4) TaxID=429009 RepID=C9R7Z0_AMMDK|nr:Stp1/IreP family PP2C-type Ser/Thr phosphatase [Ammonifex degensii]ACX52419.1 protein serine/threonine phosphatase [Ammonifex degensii KC4]
MEWVAKSDQGLIRPRNEDAYLVLPDKGLFAVADGLGGHQAGEVASQLAVSTVAQFWQEEREVSLEKLVAAVKAANEAVYRASLARPECMGMGTTLTVCLLKEKELLWAHVGDSRGYLLRGEEISQFTRDHTLVAELLREGEISPEEVKYHPYRHVLSRALGIEATVEVDAGSFVLEQGDIILLCTDGLTLHLAPEEILRLVREAESLPAGGEKLLAEALERGGEDNITLVMVRIDD